MYLFFFNTLEWNLYYYTRVQGSNKYLVKRVSMLRYTRGCVAAKACYYKRLTLRYEGQGSDRDQIPQQSQQKILYAVVYIKRMVEKIINLIKKFSIYFIQFFIFIQKFSARTNEGVKHTTWEVWSQGGNPNHQTAH